MAPLEEVAYQYQQARTKTPKDKDLAEAIRCRMVKKGWLVENARDGLPGDIALRITDKAGKVHLFAKDGKNQTKQIYWELLKPENTADFSVMQSHTRKR